MTRKFVAYLNCITITTALLYYHKRCGICTSVLPQLNMLNNTNADPHNPHQGLNLLEICFASCLCKRDVSISCGQVHFLGDFGEIDTPPMASQPKVSFLSVVCWLHCVVLFTNCGRACLWYYDNRKHLVKIKLLVL